MKRLVSRPVFAIVMFPVALLITPFAAHGQGQGLDSRVTALETQVNTLTQQVAVQGKRITALEAALGSAFQPQTISPSTAVLARASILRWRRPPERVRR